MKGGLTATDQSKIASAELAPFLSLLSSQGHTAVDMQLYAIDEATRLRGEKESGAGQFFGLSETASRDDGSQMAFERRAIGIRNSKLAEDRSIYRPGLKMLTRIFRGLNSIAQFFANAAMAALEPA